LVNWDLSDFKFSDTNAVFQTAIFLFWSYEITKGPHTSGIDGKPTIAFQEIVYIAVILSYVSASDCSLNRLNL